MATKVPTPAPTDTDRRLEELEFLAEVASEGIDIATRDSISVAVPKDFHPGYRDPG